LGELSQATLMMDTIEYLNKGEEAELIVECRDEADQKAKFEKLKGEGYKLRILTL